jgi:hypothetical protein
MKRLLLFVTRYFYGAGSCLYLFTAGILSARHRRLLFKICQHFGYPFPWLAARWGTPEPQIPQVDLSALVRSDTCIKSLEPVQNDGNVSLLEILTINSLITIQQPKTVFEIGTFDGRTTMNMAANSPPDAFVYTLDLPREDVERTRFPISQFDRPYIEKSSSGERFQNSDCIAKIRQLIGDSATFDYAPYHQKMDFVLVDGSHSFDYALNDSLVAGRLISGRGIILWHDYANCEGVTQALDALYGQGGHWSKLRWIKGTSFAYLLAKRENTGTLEGTAENGMEKPRLQVLSRGSPDKSGSR